MHYNKRWYTKQTFYEQYPNLQPTLSIPHANSIEDDNTQDDVATKNIITIATTLQHNKQHELDDVDMGLCVVSPNMNITQQEQSTSSNRVNSGFQKRVTYNDLIREVTSLCQVVHNSQEHAKHVMSTIKDWKQRIQMKHNFRIHFLELPTSQPQDVALNTMGNELKTPLRGAVQGPQGKGRKRLKSRHEGPTTTTNIKRCVPPNALPPIDSQHKICSTSDKWYTNT